MSGKMNIHEDHRQDSPGLTDLPSDREQISGNGDRILSVKEGDGKDIQREMLYEKIFLLLKNVFDSLQQEQMFSIKPGLALIKEIASDHTPDDPLFIRSVLHDSLRDYYIWHAVNTTVYAVKLTGSMGWSPEGQQQAGLTALFHNIGISMIPEKLIYQEAALSPKESEMIRGQAEMSREILQTRSDADPFLCESVIQVNEKTDGSGYPAGLKGDGIHPVSQIVGLLNIYEALIHSRPRGGRLMYHTAMREMIRAGKKCFSRKYMKAFLDYFSFFPLHSHVRLNTNIMAKVVETFPGHPLRPRVRIPDEQQRGNGQIISLRENSLLYIVESVSEREFGPKTDV